MFGYIGCAPKNSFAACGRSTPLLSMERIIVPILKFSMMYPPVDLFTESIYPSYAGLQPEGLSKTA